MRVEFVTMIPTLGDGPYPTSDSSDADGWTGAAAREPRMELYDPYRIGGGSGWFWHIAAAGRNSVCLDGWVASAFIATHTTTLRFLVALRPGFVAPTVAARQASTFDYLFGRRLSINVVTGGSPPEQTRDGDFLAHDGRYERTREFIQLVRHR